MSFPDAHADVVLASAVLHFARDDDHFRGMLADPLKTTLVHGRRSMTTWVPRKSGG